MSLHETVLKFGVLSVRGARAIENRKIALQNGVLKNARARYVFSGFEPAELFIAGERQAVSPEARGIFSAEIFGAGGCVFFDQTHYTFVIHLPEAESAKVFSPLASWCDAADWDNDTRRLVIPLNFGNDVGRFALCWEWTDMRGEPHEQSIEAYVFSSKLDVQEHVKTMIATVSAEFNWLRLDMLRQTQWTWEQSEDASATQQSWLLIFQHVRQDMERGFRRLVVQHRRRLMPHTRYMLAHRIRKMSGRLEERVARGLKENPATRHAVEESRLQADTPENRYMKHILLRVLGEIHSVNDRIAGADRISDTFKERMKEWADAWERLRHQHFWRGIGEFQGLRRESLVLTHDPLYVSIRRSWHALKQGLTFFDEGLRGGIQNIAQLYEIWCLAELLKVLKDLEWTSEAHQQWEVREDEWEGDDARVGTFRWRLTKKEYANADLFVLFQPKAASEPASEVWEGVFSRPQSQFPDIVLRLERKGEATHTWIFDAKYRIDKGQAPADAINRMHAYRDAILTAEGSDSTRIPPESKRESIGAFVLYPGADTETDQYRSVGQVSIGAFSLRPGIESKRLRQRLEEWLDPSAAMKDLYAHVPRLKYDVLRDDRARRP